MNKIFEKHCQDLKFSPPVSNAFTLTQTKLPLNKFLLLVFKRVLRYQFLKVLLSPSFEYNTMSIEKFIILKTFEKWWWCGPFALG
jgi:hypothetical protein